MARVRRKATAKTRLNFEIAGIAALGLAVLFGIALIVRPSHGGFIGSGMAHYLRLLFGMGAGLFPILVALVGAIIFLEINVPRMIGTLGMAALGYFLIIDASFGKRGGWVGSSIWSGSQAMLGVVGTRILLVVLLLVLTIWITNVSVKKVIGWLIGTLSRVRVPQFALPQGHASVREAFDLAQPSGRPPQPVRDPADAGSAIVPITMAPFIPTRPSEIVIEEAPFDSGFASRTLAQDDKAQDDNNGDSLRAVTQDLPATSVILSKDSIVSNPLSTGVVEGERHYRLPDLSLFDPPQAQIIDDSTRSHVLEDTLASFGVGAKVTHIERGPSITRYELRPERGVKISKISSLADDIALALAATSVRIEAPIPGKSAVGIEVPNATVSIVTIREILEALPQRGQIPPLNMALGKDITGRAVFGDLGKMPHLLVAGATGAGKSVCLNCIIASLLVCATPDQVQLLMIDPKRVELTVYNGIPHLIKDVITDARMAAGALFEMTKEMDARYERFAKAGVRKIEEYNAKFPGEKLPYVVIIIDELADLMLVAPAKVETTICRLAQLARATGIHLIVATQRPSVDVITGIIKANIPSRIAFAVSSQVDSRTILDMGGAERLLGRGDMLYLPIDAPKPVRSQGALITGAEVNRLVDFWAKQARPGNLLEVEVVPISDDDAAKKDVDPLCYQAAKYIIEGNFASTAQLQAQFSIGHPRAVRVMKQLEEFNVVGPHEGTKPRRIILGISELEQIASRLGRDNQQDLFATGS
ncbi:MAG: DNA translocase FtsK [Candidatus Eremiobacteraeota bacterium]|nr:DNA translocase FtsK [Candidatus Eremiobacteraeota bacterium]